MPEILSHTESVCPECLARIPADRVLLGEDVYLEKICPEHGKFSTVIWRGQPAFTSWVRPKTPSFPQKPFTKLNRGCPYDCGLCPDHRQTTCCVLLEITQRCDLHCPVCFADSGNTYSSDWSMSEIVKWYERLMASGGPFNIQLSGGEPCMRDDLPEIIRMGRSFGFTFFQLNTNGLRLARDPAYFEELKAAGLSTVFLQFDGTNDATYKRLRGCELYDKKMAVIERCDELDLGVVLVPTLVPGVNMEDIGNIILLALAHMPTVRGVHFQPISYFGRYPDSPRDQSRVTIPEVIRAIECQTDGMIRVDAFIPPGAENAICSFHGNFILMPDGVLKALSHKTMTSCCCQPAEAAQGAKRSREFVANHWSLPAPMINFLLSKDLNLDELEIFLEHKRTHSFCLSGMAFQDAWTLDLERLRDCYLHIASTDGRLVPFCAYNLTDRQGRSLYRKAHENHPA